MSLQLDEVPETLQDQPIMVSSVTLVVPRWGRAYLRSVMRSKLFLQLAEALTDPWNISWSLILSLDTLRPMP